MGGGEEGEGKERKGEGRGGDREREGKRGMRKRESRSGYTSYHLAGASKGWEEVRRGRERRGKEREAGGIGRERGREG